MHTLMSANANTVLSFLIGFCIGAVVVGVHYGKKLIEQPSGKEPARIVDMDEDITESVRYSWRKKEKQN